jgi:hypothetical protein
VLLFLLYRTRNPIAAAGQQQQRWQLIAEVCTRIARSSRFVVAVGPFERASSSTVDSIGGQLPTIGKMSHTPRSRRHFRAARCASAAAATLMHACHSICSAAAQPLLDLTEETWSTAGLSVARSSVAATSLPNDGVALFAGGYGTFFVH